MNKPIGRLILITGRSGAGKDTLINGLRSRYRDNKQLLFAKRAITRAPDTSGENHLAMTEAEFFAHKRADKFWIDWQAHGLYYALPMQLHAALQEGVSVLANVSRTMIGPLSELWPATFVIEIDSQPATISERLKKRGRETHTDIQQRLQRNVPPAPEHVTITKLFNDGSVEQGVNLFEQLINDVLQAAKSRDPHSTEL